MRSKAKGEGVILTTLILNYLSNCFKVIISSHQFFITGLTDRKVSSILLYSESQFSSLFDDDDDDGHKRFWLFNVLGFDFCFRKVNFFIQYCVMGINKKKYF